MSTIILSHLCPATIAIPSCTISDIWGIYIIAVYIALVIISLIFNEFAQFAFIGYTDYKYQNILS